MSEVITMSDVCVVGAGFSGAVIARQLAEAGISCFVIDERPHVGGNCHTERDLQTGIMVHHYGPHIFHTNHEIVWNYVSRFCVMMPYRHTVKAVSRGQVYSFPINLHTLNQFFSKKMSPKEAIDYINSLSCSNISSPKNFEEQALKYLGEDIYNAFFKEYTIKQWGVDPSLLPAGILKRLPIRFIYNDNYFSDKYQGIPKNGYTNLINNILDHRNITVKLRMRFEDIYANKFAHIVYSGPIDRFFSYKFGFLKYRTLDFEMLYSDMDYQGCAVVNYCDLSVPYTRITEHKYFSYWDKNINDLSVVYKEYSRDCRKGDIPYYPLRALDGSLYNLKKYVDYAKKEVERITFVGRLGTYSYLDMDITILRALQTSDVLIRSLRDGYTAPAFVHDPIG